MITRQVALVAESKVSFSDLTRASAAIQKQATRDFGPLWDIEATVDAFAKLEDVPLGYWPVIIADDIGQPGALGVHMDKDNQPFALVEFGDGWELTASHETLEMLCDPFGNRLVAGDSPMQEQGRVEFLVEVCDPSEAAQFGYTVNGLTLSDFYTPNYFDPTQAPGVRYSFTGAITEPRQVLQGGYLSWVDQTTGDWWQETYFGAQPEFRNLGKPDASERNLRAFIDRYTNAEARKSMMKDRKGLLAAARAYGDFHGKPSVKKAEAWRAQIAELKEGGGGDGGGSGPPPPPGPGRRRAPRPRSGR
jgi:hypothetical protein